MADIMPMIPSDRQVIDGSWVPPGVQPVEGVGGRALQ